MPGVKGMKNPKRAEQMRGNRLAARDGNELAVPLKLNKGQRAKLEKWLVGQGITPSETECRKACRQIFSQAFDEAISQLP